MSLKKFVYQINIYQIKRKEACIKKRIQETEILKNQSLVRNFETYECIPIRKDSR